MAEETNNAPAAKGGIGHIVRVVGPVVDVEFAPSEMPAIYNALRIDADTPIGHIKLVMEVQMHLPGDLVRAVAMSSTDGLTRGLEVQDTGAPMMMPVGPETLGRIWNVVGEPVDGKPMPDIKEWMPIHRPAPAYDELTTTTEIFETGIKSIDLIEPFFKGGKTGLFGGAGVVENDLRKHAVRPAAYPEIHVVLDLPRNDVGVRALGCDDQVDTEGTAQPGDGRQSVFNLA